MTQNDEIEMDAETESWLLSAIGAGESDFRQRVVKKLLEIEAAERKLMRQAANLRAARSHRDRADAMKGAASIVGGMPLIGTES